MATDTAMNQGWTSAPERSNLLLMRVMSWISLRLGRPVARLVLHPIAAYFLLFSPAARRASHDYLRRVLPDGSVRWRDQYRHFFSFAATVHDRMYLANGRMALFEFEMHGSEHFEHLRAARQGIFLLGAHLGSFDMVRASGQQFEGLRVVMVMHEGNAQMLHATLASINPQATQDIIALGSVDSMLRVSERLAEGNAIGILADRTPGNEPRQAVTFLGGTAHLPIGPFRMAALLQRPVLFMAGLYLGANRYAVHFDTIADFSAVTREQREAAISDAIARYASLLERYCRLAPYNWFNFFDFWQAAPKGAAPHTR